MTPKACANWLTLMGYGFVAFGLIWIFTAFSGMDKPARLLIDILDWPLDGSLQNPSKEARWMGAIGAGLTCGFGVIFARVIAPLIARDEPAVGRIVKNGTLLALTVWLVVDSAGSITSGVPSNAVFNLMFYLGVAVPLATVKFTAAN